MITRMEIVSSQPGAPALPLGGFMPSEDPVQILGIDGLGPVKSDMASTPFATGRGELYQGSSTGKRNIILTLGLNPNWIDQTLTSLRHLLYRYFMPESWVRLMVFSDELPDVYINGIVESLEPNLFSQDPEVQVSILCPKPDFIQVGSTLLSGTTSDLTTPETVVVEYTGTVTSGFELRIEPSDDVPVFDGELVITNEFSNLYQEFRVQDAMINWATYIKINTVRSTRQLYNVLIEEDKAINILAKMEQDSIWPEFSPGVNLLTVMTTEAGLNWKLGFFNRFGGL